MSNATALPPGTDSKPTTPENDGLFGRKIGELDSFKSSPGTSAPSPGKASTSGGKKSEGKGKKGRPPKNGAGFSKDAIDEEMDDPQIEAARAQFEEVIVYFLVATTDGFAESRFTLLRKKFPNEAEARALADKAKLTDEEKKIFGGIAVDLWRKYLGDKYLFTKEGIAAIFLLQYGMRNFEGFNQTRKIEAELNAKSDPKQSRVQSAPKPDPGHDRNGKIDVGPSAALQPSGRIDPGL